MKRFLALLFVVLLLSISAFAARPAVIDALNYEKEVILADYAADSGYKKGDFGNHIVRIPKINVNSYGAQILNQQMKEPYMEVHEALVDNQEENSIVIIDYEYREAEGVIGIVIKEMHAVQGGGGNVAYKAFYYDSNTDKILDFNEYLSALNVKKSALTSNSFLKKCLREAGCSGSVEVYDAVLDSDSALVYIKAIESMDGWLECRSDKPIVAVSPRPKNELYVGEEDEIVMTIGSKTAYVFKKDIENDVAPVIVNGRTMLPARFVVENLGGKISWNEPEQKVTIEKGNITIVLIINSDIATVNGKKIKLDCPVFIKEGRTYTPVRFVAERLGATVEWIENTQQVVITPNSLDYEKLFADFCNGHDLVDEIVSGMKKSQNEYIAEGADSKADTTISNTFLVDLNNDLIPEMCVTTSGPGMEFDVFIFEYINGGISMRDFVLNNGAGGSSGWHNSIAIMEDGTARIVSGSSGSVVTTYSIFELDGGSVVESVSLTYGRDGDFSVNHERVTEEEYDKVYMHYSDIFAEYDKYLINNFECSFAEVWDYQKKQYSLD